jgi:hypothetical protein
LKKYFLYFLNGKSSKLEMITIEVIMMAKQKIDPSKAGVSAASVQGDAGPNQEREGKKKVNSQNNQYKK